MTSKLVYDRAESARFVGSADTHLPAAAGKLEKMLAPLLQPGEAMPDFALVGRLVLRLLERETRVMLAADLAHETELRDDPPVRKERDDNTADLLDAIGETRLALTQRFGQDFGGATGVAGSAPSDPKGALAFAQSFTSALAKTDVPVKPNAITTFNKDSALTALRALIGRLDRSLGDVDREVREAEATQVAKDKAIATYDETFGLCATFVSAFLTAAGERTLASRVRPSQRRIGRTDPEPSPDEPTPAPAEPETPPNVG